MKFVRAIVAQAVREQASAIRFGVRPDRCFAQYLIGDQWVDRHYGPLKTARLVPLGLRAAGGGVDEGDSRFRMTLRDWTVAITAIRLPGTPDIELALEYSTREH